MLFALVGIVSTSFATSTHKINHQKKSVAHVEAQLGISEVAEMMGTEESEIAYFFGMDEDTQTVQVYNGQDELVAEGPVDFAGISSDPELTQALQNASRLMTIGDTHIYRTNQ
ncbi:MAG TPA: hypothetical protein DCE41_26410 [Cytophagales bacterium]|nr:hypothetical protein [Cytophagales bacterium]